MSVPPTITAVGTVRQVWIETGCITCGWCSDLIPDVFAARVDGSSVIRGEVRVDGRTDRNQRKTSPLRKPLSGADAEFIQFVADGCPPRVIRFSE